jgi:hypothetical protein
MVGCVPYRVGGVGGGTHLVHIHSLGTAAVAVIVVVVVVIVVVVVVVVAVAIVVVIAVSRTIVGDEVESLGVGVGHDCVPNDDGDEGGDKSGGYENDGKVETMESGLRGITVK